MYSGFPDWAAIGHWEIWASVPGARADVEVGGCVEDSEQEKIA